MKRFRSITFITSMIILLLMISHSYSYAAESKVYLNGKSEVETGIEQTIMLKVSNEEEVGVIQGKIGGDANIEILNVEAKDTNWVVYYNSTTKQFDAYYADGVKEGEIIAIKYKLKDGAITGTINLNDVKLTTVTYNSITNSDVEKIVTAKPGGSNNGGSGTSNGNNGNSGSNNKNDENSESSSGAESKQNKSSNGIIPKLGQSGLVMIAIIGSAIFAIRSFYKLKRKK